MSPDETDLSMNSPSPIGLTAHDVRVADDLLSLG